MGLGEKSPAGSEATSVRGMGLHHCCSETMVHGGRSNRPHLHEARAPSSFATIYLPFHYLPIYPHYLPITYVLLYSLARSLPCFRPRNRPRTNWRISLPITSSTTFPPFTRTDTLVVNMAR